MNWVRHCLKHKLAIYLLSLALSLLGIVALFVVPITPFPLPPSKNISIEFSYPGANATTVQTQIIQKVVNALQSLNNVRYIEATAKPDSAFIFLQLNSDQAQDMLQTQIKINQAISSSNLPSIVPQPHIVTSMSDSSLITFIVSSDRLSLFQLDNFIQSTLYPKFSSVPGVAMNTPNMQPEVKIKLNPEKMAKYKLAANKIASLIDITYQNNPLGSMQIQNQNYQLNLSQHINSLNDFAHIIVGYQMHGIGRPIYLSDIADISFEPKDITATNFHSFNGHSADAISLFTHGISNPFTDSSITKNYVATLKQHLPDWIKIFTIGDSAKNMKKAIDDVIYTIVIATILVLAIALIFLGHLRTTAIPIITVPICLLGAVAIMAAVGMSINLLSLLALVIAVGLVVDDAIVVVENITRHLEMGMNKLDAILHGTADIALTIIGITATLLAVYLPITFCTGMFVGFLKAFALPLASAVLISGILALTLTPIMAVTFISDAPQNNYQKKFTKLLNRAISFQHYLLEHLLRAPLIALCVIVALLFIGGYYTLKLPKAYFPTDPNGSINIVITGTGNDTVDTLRQKAAQFKTFYDSSKLQHYDIDIEPNQQTHKLTATIDMRYKVIYLHQILEFTNLINTFIKQHNIKNTYAKMLKSMNSGGNTDLSFDLYGNTTPKQLNHIATRITAIMKKSSLFSMTDNSINQLHKQLSFYINYAKAAKFGIFQDQISQALSTYFGGHQLNNDMSIDGLSVPVVVQLDTKDLEDPLAISKLQIQSPTTNAYLPLNEFVTLGLTAEPTQIDTFNNLPDVEIDANLAKGQSLGTAIDYINQLISTTAPSLQYQYVDKAQLYLEGNAQTKLVLGLGIVCVYFLLAILFGNLIDPLIIMLTVPFSVIGGALALYLVQGTLNIFSVFGLITLIGLITKHGVLIVQFANQEIKDKGANIRDAILTATHHRFRPIMMTTLAMTLGALPLVFSGGHMYVSRQDLGIVIIGGLIIGTIFSMLIVPLVYALIKRVEV